jgi:arginine repressor
LTAARRRRAAELIAAADPRITTREQLGVYLEEEGFGPVSVNMLIRDLRAIGAVKVKPPKGSRHYVLKSQMQNHGDRAVAESEARARVQQSGLKVIPLTGAVPILLQTLDHAGHLTGQPFQTWLPRGVIAVQSSNEGVLFWCEPDEADQVQEKLTRMMLGG